MSMNDAELAAVVAELQPLVGSSVSGLWQPSRDRVILGLADRLYLLMVPRGPLARLHTESRRPRNPSKPYSFQGACRARLRGPLVGLDKHPHDRIVTLRFHGAALELRLTGRSGGLWLLDEDGAVVAAYDGPAPTVLPPLPVRPGRPSAVRFERVNDSVDLGARRHFSHLEREQRARERRGTLERRLKRSIQRTERLLRNLERDLARAEEAPALRHQADLLASHLHQVPRGATTVTLEDWDTGEPVTIELEPGRPPSDTLEQLYRRSSRLDRVADRVLERMDAAEADLERYRASLLSLGGADLDTLDALDKELPALRQARSERAVELPWTTWSGPDGQRVLVGRNERGNRRLTFQVARGSDWWMHLRGRPGAHLVLPIKRDHTPTLPHLLAAAQIALIQARIPEGAAADVQYTRVRDVRPIPGEIALVRVANERVLRVVRDPAELVGWEREEHA